MKTPKKTSRVNGMLGILILLSLILFVGIRTVSAGPFSKSPQDTIITTGYTYPDYDPGWTTNDCAQYSYAGLNEAYGRYSDCSSGNQGFNSGWVDDDKETQPNGDCKYEGADCSAYVGRCWALPGFIYENVEKGHGRSTYQIYRAGYWDKNDVQRSHRVDPNASSVVSELLQCKPWDIFVVNSDAARSLGITQSDGSACTEVNHTGLIRSLSTSNSDVYTREAVVPKISNVTRPRSFLVDRCARFHRRDDWNNANTPPVITSQPLNRTNNIGGNAFFSVTATGTSLSYQWRWKGTNIFGTTNSSYTRSNVQLSDAGNYSVVVSNAAGTATSSNAVLSVLPPNPANHSPMMAPISSQIVHAGSPIILNSLAYDPDPNDALTFNLDPGAPLAAAIHAVTGLFAWNTCDDDANTTRLITVRVADDGQPSLNGTTSFNVSVQPRPSIQGGSISGNTMTLKWNTIPGVTYRVEYKNNLGDTNWQTLGFEVAANGSVTAIDDPEFGSNSQRFYRILVVD